MGLIGCTAAEWRPIRRARVLPQAFSLVFPGAGQNLIDGIRSTTYAGASDLVFFFPKAASPRNCVPVRSPLTLAMTAARRAQTALGLLLQPRAATLLTTTTTTIRAVQAKWTHSGGPPRIPPPIPLVPDVPTLLTVIGRGLRQHASKFPSWEALFSLTPSQLKELGIEPPRTRRYLLRWLHRFRLGQFGIGADFQHVENGVAELKVLEVDKDPLTRAKYVVNVPAGKSVEQAQEHENVRVRGYKVHGARTIAGPYALPASAGAGAVVTVTEGMWEDVRGHKVDGGERRQAEVRFKRRAAERRERREKQGLM